LAFVTVTSAYRCDLGREAWHAYDSTGNLCAHSGVDPETNCCSTELKKVGAQCEQKSQCCKSYEDCVASCLQDGTTSEKRDNSYIRRFSTAEGQFETNWDYCRNKCRTNGDSTVHENNFKSDLHFCWGFQTEGPMDKATLEAIHQEVARKMPRDPSARVPAQVPAVKSTPKSSYSKAGTPGGGKFSTQKGNQGASCADTCQKSGKRCSLEGLQALNNCDTLKAQFGCALCTSSRSFGIPGFVAKNAPRHQQPGSCWVHADPHSIKCDSNSAYISRLCSCESVH